MPKIDVLSVRSTTWCGSESDSTVTLISTLLYYWASHDNVHQLLGVQHAINTLIAGMRSKHHDHITELRSVVPRMITDWLPPDSLVTARQHVRSIWAFEMVVIPLGRLTSNKGRPCHAIAATIRPVTKCDYRASVALVPDAIVSYSR